jgi:hypothetical protein
VNKETRTVPACALLSQGDGLNSYRAFGDGGLVTCP